MRRACGYFSHLFGIIFSDRPSRVFHIICVLFCEFNEMRMHSLMILMLRSNYLKMIRENNQINGCMRWEQNGHISINIENSFKFVSWVISGFLRIVDCSFFHVVCCIFQSSLACGTTIDSNRTNRQATLELYGCKPHRIFFFSPLLSFLIREYFTWLVICVFINNSLVHLNGMYNKSTNNAISRTWRREEEGIGEIIRYGRSSFCHHIVWRI